MKRIMLNCIYFLWVVGGIAILVYNIFFSDNPNYQEVAKVAAVFIVFFVSIVSAMRKQSASVQQVNENAYKEFMKDAFQDNKDAYEKLMKGMEYYNCDKQMKAVKLLDGLLEECNTSSEFSVVHFFRGLCFSEIPFHEDAIAAYREVLKYDGANSTAWSNLGVEYMETGNQKMAEEAYKNAVMYDAHHAEAYTNLSVLYLRTGEVEPAVEAALQALKIDSNQTEAMSSAVIAYKMLGDEKNAEKYRNMYIANGGDKKELRKLLEDLEE